MAGLIAKLLSPKLHPSTWRVFSRSASTPPYWESKFPDGRIRSFDEIPTVEEKNYDPRKVHEMYFRWFPKYGYVAKEVITDTVSMVHLFHFDDFKTVYWHDGNFPLRQSHKAIRQYRESRKDLYENVGLGPGNGEEWWDLRRMMPSGIVQRQLWENSEIMEEVSDDLIKVLYIKSASEGEIDMLPWLFRWAFESTGAIALNRRLGALFEEGSDLADKIVEAAGITNEMIALTEIDYANYDKNYEKLVEAQDYMYSVIIKYLEDIAAGDDSKSVVNSLLKDGNKYTMKNIVTMTLDIFQGSLQTVPLTVLMGLYNLAKNKDVQEKAREKVMKLLPEKDSKFLTSKERSTGKISPYLKGVIWETLRVNPPIIGNGRVLQEDLILGGYLVPKGTNTILHQQVAHLLEENFEEPLKFKPERHPNPKREEHINYIFGGRKRVCLGKNFALNQMWSVIAKILRNFEVSYDGGEINMINRLHNEPEHPLCLKFRPLE